MDIKKRKVLEANGWKVGDAADFLEMSDEERQLLDVRVGLVPTRQRPISSEINGGVAEIADADFDFPFDG